LNRDKGQGTRDEEEESQFNDYTVTEIRKKRDIFEKCPVFIKLG